MAAKTNFSRSDFIEMLSNYDLGEYQDSKPLSDGAVQTNFLIRTTKGEFVLKYYENRPEESVRFEANLVDYIRQRNYPCAGLFRNRRGNGVSLYSKKPYVLFEYVAGQFAQNPSTRQKRQIIHTAATLQIITKDYRPHLKRFRLNYSRELCIDLAQAQARKISTSNAQEKVKWFQRECSKISLPPSLPKGICHCDYHFSNILFRDGKLVALLDFDDANYSYLTFDLVNLIDNWAWPFEQAFDRDTAREIVQEYNRTRNLSNLEKRHLFDVHKLQILFDGIWFFARGDANDFYEKRKIEYLDVMGREGYLQALCI